MSLGHFKSHINQKALYQHSATHKLRFWNQRCMWQYAAHAKKVPQIQRDMRPKPSTLTPTPKSFPPWPSPPDSSLNICGVRCFRVERNHVHRTHLRGAQQALRRETIASGRVRARKREGWKRWKRKPEQRCTGFSYPGRLTWNLKMDLSGWRRRSQLFFARFGGEASFVVEWSRMNRKQIHGPWMPLAYPSNRSPWMVL